MFLITFMGANATIRALQDGDSTFISMLMFSFGAISLAFNLGAYLGNKSQRNYDE